MENYRYELTLDKILLTSVSNNPEQVISYRGEGSITFSEFRERVYRFARSLVAAGLKKGEKVAVLDWDSLTYLIAYYAVPMAGGILHTVNIRYSPELIFYTMRHADDRFVILRDEFVPMISDKTALFDFVTKWIVTSDQEKPSAMLDGALVAEEMIKAGAEAELPEMKEDDVVTTFYTSGTTGLPKGVKFTNRQVMLHTLVLSSVLADMPSNVKSSDVMMPLVPMFHVHSWGVPYLALFRGIKYVLPGRYDFKEIPKIMLKEKVSVTLMVPSILYLLLSNPEGAAALKSLGIRITIGGGAIPEGLANRAKAAGLKLVSGYGMSETAPVLSYGNINHSVMPLDETAKERMTAFSSVPVPLVEMRIIGEDGKEVPRDSKTIGEIVVRAPWLTSEYVNDEEGTKKLWKGGWMHTGDLAVMNRYGYISLVDREKDAVKSGGEFIPTIILEDAISTFPGVAEVAVIGKKDEKWGERPIAFISGLKEIDREKMKTHLMEYVNSGRIAKFWIPDEFHYIETFEKTSTGKIDKKALREKISS